MKTLIVVFVSLFFICSLSGSDMESLSIFNSDNVLVSASNVSDYVSVNPSSVILPPLRATLIDYFDLTPEYNWSLNADFAWANVFDTNDIAGDHTLTEFQYFAQPTMGVTYEFYVTTDNGGYPDDANITFLASRSDLSGSTFDWVTVDISAAGYVVQPGKTYWFIRTCPVGGWPGFTWSSATNTSPPVNPPVKITQTFQAGGWGGWVTDWWMLFKLYGEPGSNVDPRCDIKVDGQDSGAQVFVGASCDITVSVLAGTTYAGRNVEIWWGSQKPQYLQLWYSGPLVDKKDTVWSGPLPVGVGSYMVGMGLDGRINGTKDKLYFMDTADFQVVTPPTTYEYDDGSTENLLCWTLGGDMVWMHRFDTIPGGETIAEMHCIFGSAMYPNYAPGNGTACNVYVWNDPTNDGNPSDCVLLHTEPTVVANVDLDIYNIIPLTAPLPVVSGEFYIGCCMPHGPSQFCAPIDTTTTYVWGNGYYCGTNTVGGFDPKNLMNNQYTPAEWGNYWCIRAAY